MTKEQEYARMYKSSAIDNKTVIKMNRKFTNLWRMLKPLYVDLLLNSDIVTNTLVTSTALSINKQVDDFYGSFKQSYQVYLKVNYSNSLQTFKLSEPLLAIEDILLMAHDTDGLNYLQKLDKHRNNLKLDLLTVSDRLAGSNVVTRSSLDKLQSRVNVAKNGATRLYNREIEYNTNQIILRSLSNDNQDKYKYSAILDSRTSNACKKLDGKVFNVADAQVGVNFPPMHWNCRSFVYPVE